MGSISSSTAVISRCATQLTRIGISGVRSRVRKIKARARDYVNRSLTSVLQEASVVHNTIRRSQTLIWTTQPAAGCGSRPLDSAKGARAALDGQPEYNWRFFSMIAKEFWSGTPRAYVLDVSPLQRRVKAHPGSPGANGTGLKIEHGNTVGDCLHACDGPLRLGAVLLLNLIANIVSGHNG